MADRPQQMTAYPQAPAEPRAAAHAESVAHYSRLFESFAATLREPAERTHLRRRAIARFAELGFPTTKNEDWHFTSVAPVAAHAFELPRDRGGKVSADALRALRFGHAEWPALVFVDGAFAPALSRVTAADGVRAACLADAADDPAGGYFGRVHDWSSAAFSALNTAFFTDGAVIHVAADAAPQAPVHLIFVSTGGGVMSAPRNLVVVDHHARAAVVETYVGVGEGPYLTNAVTEVVLGDGAELHHVKVQVESAEAFHVGTVDVTQGRDSYYDSFSYATGASLSRTNIYTVLNGEGSRARLNGLYMVDGEQHVDHQTRIEHARPNCTSHEVYKGVLDGRSHAVFNGKVYVRPEAQKTDGKQENNNLLLSPHAQVDTKPQLEIFADDVKCTHGATVGRLDEQALFYLRSRGISPSRARTLLTYAFAASVLDEIVIEPVRDELEAVVLRRVGAVE